MTHKVDGNEVGVMSEIETAKYEDKETLGKIDSMMLDAMKHHFEAHPELSRVPDSEVWEDDRMMHGSKACTIKTSHWHRTLVVESLDAVHPA